MDPFLPFTPCVCSNDQVQLVLFFRAVDHVNAILDGRFLAQRLGLAGPHSLRVILRLPVRGCLLVGKAWPLKACGDPGSEAGLDWLELTTRASEQFISHLKLRVHLRILLPGGYREDLLLLIGGAASLPGRASGQR